MSTGNFKQDIYEQLARVAKAIGHANRLELLEFVSQVGVGKSCHREQLRRRFTTCTPRSSTEIPG